LKNIDLELN